MQHTRTYLWQSEEGVAVHDLGGIAVHELVAGLLEGAQGVEAGHVVDEADVVDAEDGAQVVRDGHLQLGEAVLVGKP